MLRTCPKCNADAYVYNAREGHEQVEHVQCRGCKYIFPVYGECSLCKTFSSDAANSERINKARVSNRIRQDFKTLGGVRSKERAAARKAAREALDNAPSADYKSDNASANISTTQGVIK